MATTKKPLDWKLVPAPESSDHVRIDKQYELFINGKLQKPRSGKYFNTINPANEQKLARIAQAGEADVDAAVKAARKAYDTVWSRMPAPERGKYIYRIARLLQKNARGFAIIESTGADKDDLEWCHMDLPFATATLPARCALPSWDDNTHCITRHGIETH